MKRVKEFLKNNYVIICSFLATLFLYFLVLFIHKIYPFGGATFIYSDMFEQYVSYFNYVRDAILNGESLFASFSFSLGENFYGILTYYCLSPLNILFLFSTNATMPTFILIVALLKLSLSAASMAILLKNKLKSNVSVFVFSVLYGLMTYNIIYVTNIMWLDPIYLLPLIILGLERLDKKPWLYLITLTIAMCSNYYIAFSICIFLVLYFIYYVLLNKVDFKKYLFNFIKYSLIAALLSSVVLIPTIFNMLAGKFETTKADFSFKPMYNPFYLLYKFLASDNKMALSDLPYVTSSLLVLVMLVLYLFCKNITKKDKIITFSFIAILILITVFPFTDTIMHCFRLPNQFTYRYAFVVSFFLILSAAKCFDRAEFNKKNILIYLLIGLLIWLYLKLYIDFKTLFSSIIVLLYLFAVLFLEDKRLLAFAIIPLMCGELLINASSDFVFVGRNSYEQYEGLFKYEEELNKLKPDQTSFYRISGLNHVTLNDAIAYKYYGITSFSPTISVNTNKVLKDYFGLPLRKSYAVDYLPSTEFSDAFLNVKYKYDISEDFKYFESKYVFPVMFKIKDNNRFKQGETLIETQNNLYKYLSNTDEIIFYESDNYKIKDCRYEDGILISEGVGYCTFVNDDLDNVYYLEIKDLTRHITPIYPGNSTGEYHGENFILILNKMSMTIMRDDELKLDYLYVYKLDEEKLAELNTILNENGLEIISHSQSKISGKITNDEDNQIMFTSIPYNKGWHVYINNKEVETFKNLDSLLAFKLPKGELTVDISFIPEGFNIGLFISLLTFDLLFVVKVVKKSKED